MDTMIRIDLDEYRLYKCRDEHEHRPFPSTIDELETELAKFRDSLRADGIENDELPLGDGMGICFDGWLFDPLPFTERRYRERATPTHYIARDARARLFVRVADIANSFEDRARLFGPNAKVNGRAVYAERLREPFLGFTYKLFEVQAYGSVDRFARFDEVKIDRNAPFNSLREF